MLLAASSARLAPAPHRSPVASTPHFAFYSDFDTNLNDALVTAGVARRHAKPELFHAGAEVACFGELPSSSRAAWEKAVDYYAEVISPAEWSDRQQLLVRVQLAGFDDEIKTAEDREFVEIARSFRTAATPAYKRCRWAAQDEMNRRWIDALKPRLAEYEKQVAARLEQLYRREWGGLPIPVDIVQTVNWSGANSILRDPNSGHLLISNENDVAAALEVVFHEASHLLMGRGAPVQQALADAAAAAGYRLPGDLWHVVLFYTTGEAVRQILDPDGKSNYKPMLYGIFDRGSWAEYREALETTWRPYVAGSRSLDEAAAGLIDAIRKSEPAKPSEKPR
jgi:hypothetical protein